MKTTPDNPSWNQELDKEAMWKALDAFSARLDETLSQAALNKFEGYDADELVILNQGERLILATHIALPKDSNQRQFLKDTFTKNSAAMGDRSLVAYSDWQRQWPEVKQKLIDNGTRVWA